MGDLRLFLLLAGVALVVGVWWWGSRRASARRDGVPKPRAEPTIATHDEPGEGSSESTTPGLAARQPASAAAPSPMDEALPAVPLPDEAPARGFDPDRQMLLTLFIVPASGQQLLGSDVFVTLDEVGLRHGARRIFHRETDQGAVVFSVAHLAEPGELDPLGQRFEYLQGLALFAVLPGPRPGTDAFADLLATARRIAQRLHAELTDGERSTLTPQTIQHLREKVLAFERQHGRGGA